MKKLINWLKASLEGSDGKSSSKMLTLFWIVILISLLDYFFVRISFRIVEQTAPTDASLKTLDRIRDLISIHFVVLLILFGVATIASIIQLFKIFRGQPVTDEPIMKEVVTKTSQTVTEIKPKTNEEIQSNTPASDSGAVG